MVDDPVQRVLPALRRGARFDLPETMQGASKEAAEALSDLHALGVRIDKAKAEAVAAREELVAYPATRKAELLAAAREDVVAPADQTGRLQNAVADAEANVAALHSLSMEVVRPSVHAFQVSAADIRLSAEKRIATRQRKAATQVRKAVEELAATRDDAALVAWTFNIGLKVRAPKPSQVESTLADVLAEIGEGGDA